MDRQYIYTIGTVAELDKSTEECRINEATVTELDFGRSSLKLSTSNDTKKTKENKCDVCSKVYKQKSHLLRHKRSAHEDLKFTCSICEVSFNRKDNFTRHMNQHKDNKFSVKRKPDDMSDSISKKAHRLLETDENEGGTPNDTTDEENGGTSNVVHTGKCVCCSRTKPLLSGKRLCAPCGVQGRKCNWCHCHLPEGFHGDGTDVCDRCLKRRETWKTRNQRDVGISALEGSARTEVMEPSPGNVWNVLQFFMDNQMTITKILEERLQNSKGLSVPEAEQWQRFVRTPKLWWKRMENESESGDEKEMNTNDDDEEEEDDDNGALLDLEDDDDIDMDDIRLFDEEDLCVSETSQENQVMQEDCSGTDDDDDDEQELCPFDNDLTTDKNKTQNKKNSSENCSIGSVECDKYESQEIFTSSKDRSLPQGASQNVSLERKAMFQQETGQIFLKENERKQQHVEEASRSESGVQQEHVITKGQGSGTKNIRSNPRESAVLNEDQQELSKVQSDIDDIKLVKPKERKSPRKAIREAVTIATGLESELGLDGSGLKISSQATTEPTTPSNVTTDELPISEANSPEVIAIDDPSPVLEVESDQFDIESGPHGAKSRHKCYLCEVTFNSKVNLTVHTRTVHSYYPQLPPCGCTHCGAQFKSEEFAYKHEHEVHSLDTACAFCGKNQSTKEALQTHVCNHLQPLTYLCMLCREDFPSVVEAENHLSKHKGEVAFWSDFLKCRLCGSLFNKRDKLYAHVMKVHEDLFQVKCKSCSQPFYLDSALAVHRSDQYQRLDGKRIRVNDNIPIQLSLTSGKVSKESIDISEDGSVESHNEACALKLKNNVSSSKPVNHQNHLEMMYHLGRLDTNVKDSASTAKKSDGAVSSKSTKRSNSGKITAKHSLMAKLLDRKNFQKTSETPKDDKDQEAKKSDPALIPDSLENYFQRIMFRMASNIQELLRYSLTIEGHVTQQSHQFLAKVYDQKFKVVMVLWTELQGLTQAVKANVFAKGNSLSKDLVDELVFGILKNVHSLRKSKVETILLMGQCMVKSFQELIKVMVGRDTIVTPGLQLIAVNHYEQWLDFFPTIIDGQWNVFKESATIHTNNKNKKVLETVGRLWHSRVTLNEAVLLKRDEIKKWKEGLHPAAMSFRVEEEVEDKENSKQMLFKMTSDTAVFVTGRSSPVAISSVEPGTEVTIPVGKLPPEKQGRASDTVNILPGTQSSNAGGKANMVSPVAHLPGFLANDQPKDNEYRLAYISERYLQDRISPENVLKPQQPISIDLISDNEDDDAEHEIMEDNIECSDDDSNERRDEKSPDEPLMLVCKDDDPVNVDTDKDMSDQVVENSGQVTIVTNKDIGTDHMELDCVTIKPEPMDYHNTTVDLCLVDDDEDDDFNEKSDENDENKDPVSFVILDSENNEEIKIMLVEDDDAPEIRRVNANPQIKQEISSDSSGNMETSDPVQSIKRERTSPEDEVPTLTRPQPDLMADIPVGPPNKKLKLVQVFNGATNEDINTHLLEGEITPRPASMPEVKTESIKEGYPDRSGETTLKVKKEPLLSNSNDISPTSAITHTVIHPKLKLEPVDSRNVDSCAIAENSMESYKCKLQQKEVSQSDSKVVKSEPCDTQQSDLVVISEPQPNSQIVKSVLCDKPQSDSVVNHESQTNSIVVKSEPCGPPQSDSLVIPESQSNSKVVKSEPSGSPQSDSGVKSKPKLDSEVKSEPLSDAEVLKAYYAYS
ncbi:uncharacterized protein LOC117342275 isoform X2 [Pecten maximus]|uniref:uncharacterized protein LOC117342275 isoform X2 n=1 Tax=Pecten maximus TaxID=6579 RepID=UPI001458BAA9|nr:uncharacterized protein LOC117342275 isoform X2 [Pecten maximus]